MKGREIPKGQKTLKSLWFETHKETLNWIIYHTSSKESFYPRRFSYSFPAIMKHWNLEVHPMFQIQMQ